jgi:replicative DNA helicase
MAKSACKASVSRFGGSEFPKEEIWSEVESVYTPFWKGGTFSCRDGKSPWLTKICSELGVHKCNTEEDYEYKPMRFSDLRNDFKDYVLNIEKNTIKTGIPSIDDAIFLSNNANVVVLGAAGSGKTSLGLEILSNTSKAGVKSVCASLDMAKNRIFEKVLYRLSGIKREPLYDIFKTGQEQSLIDKLDEEFGNVYFFKKSSVSVKDLRNYIISCNESSEEPVKLVVIDYFERITSDLGDDTAASKRIAGEIQDLVDDLGVCVITLVQPNKNSVYGGPDKPLYDYTAIKGSSFVYQSARIIMSVWRPFYSPKDFKNDRFMQVAVLKNDLGELDEFAFGWEGSRGLITELDEFQKEELDMLLKQKQQPNLF